MFKNIYSNMNDINIFNVKSIVFLNFSLDTNQK